MRERLHRHEVAEDLTWNLSDLFSTDEEWAAEGEQLLEEAARITEFQGRLGESSDTLADCLEAEEQIFERLQCYQIFASLRFSGDGGSATNQENLTRAHGINASMHSQLSFISAELLELNEEVLHRYVSESPRLKDFERVIHRLLLTKTHRFSKETEKVLAALGEVHGAPYTIYQRGKSSDMQFESIRNEQGHEQPVSFALYEDHYELSTNTAERRQAYDSFVKTLHAYKNTFAAVYGTEVRKQVILSRERSYPSATHMLLEPQEVELDTYHNIHDIILRDLAPHMRRLANLKKRLLNVDTLLHCDLKVPVDPDYQPEITFSESREQLQDGLAIMGSEYRTMLERALHERWIDLADNVGKSTGAFCASPYRAHQYILITWTDTMRSTFVLAHELGHAGHFYFAGKAQRFTNVRPSMFFIEAPSTLNELLLGQHLLSQSTSAEFRRWVVMQQLNTYYHNFVTHLLEAELQRRVYALAEKNVPVTADLLCREKRSVLETFWGDAVHIDEGATLTWMRQPHYYMGLYPYTYAAGLTASTAVASQISAEGATAAARWLDVLRLGGTRGPLDLMKTMGIDLSKPEPVQDAVRFVGSLVLELENSFASTQA